MDTPNDLLKSIVLPVMPEVGLALIRTLDDPEVTMEDVHKLITRDPALTVKLLALANSAAFGLPRKVAALDEAMRMVGLSRIRTMALSACLHNAFSLPEGMEASNFWRYCMACAGYAQWLAGGLRQKPDAQRAWLTGMMLRLGEIMLAQTHPGAAAIFEQPGLKPGERWKLEKSTIGIYEGGVSAEMARRWNFPPDIVLTLRHAADPLAHAPLDPMAGVLHLAGLLADVPQAGADALDILPVPLMAALELPYDWMQKTFPDASGFLNLSA